MRHRPTPNESTPSGTRSPGRWLAALVFAAVAAATTTTAFAQPAATFRNDLAQRMVACSTCHGAQGRAAPDGYYPRIAGKPAGYLYNQLLSFRDGRRHYGMMVRMVEPLSDAYLWEIAQYFSQLDLPYPPPQAPKADAATLAQGETLVRQGAPSRGIPACASCHGDAMTGLAPNIPGLLGVPRDYINSQIGAWQSGARRAHAPDCMAGIAKRLTTDDVHALSSWLAAQAVPEGGHPASVEGRSLPLECGSARLPVPGAAASGVPK